MTIVVLCIDIMTCSNDQWPIIIVCGLLVDIDIVYWLLTGEKTYYYYDLCIDDQWLLYTDDLCMMTIDGRWQYCIVYCGNDIIIDMTGIVWPLQLLVLTVIVLVLVLLWPDLQYWPIMCIVIEVTIDDGIIANDVLCRSDSNDPLIIIMMTMTVVL